VPSICPIRLLALDLDGTLLDSRGRVPDVNRRALARAIDAGVEVAIATGRRYEFARSILEQLPAPLTLILSNGAIVRSGDGRTLQQRLLPRAAARQVLESAGGHRREAALIFDREREGQVVFERIDWANPRIRLFCERNREFVCEVDPLEQALSDEDPVQVMFTGSCAPMRVLFDGLRRRLADAATPEFSVTLTEYLGRDFTLVDVLQAGCSKGLALREWAARQGIAAGEVMAMGDNLNDLEMLEFAGRPVIMGNAVEELRARGWAEAATNDNAGVARAIETFVFGAASNERAWL
jgi:Cof subfamily protein (haloacid dehalogenase superfamily)